jgi:hypothetical protein
MTATDLIVLLITVVGFILTMIAFRISEKQRR